MIRFYHASDPYGFLSNYDVTPFTLDGLEWRSVEHYFQAQKFPADAALRERVRAQPTPDAAKTLARSLPLGVPDWESVRDGVMARALRAKFTQNASLRARLIATAGTPLVERSRSDFYWGEGADGSGRNRLGALLGALREELRKELAEEPGGAAPANRFLLDWLLGEGRIPLRRSPILDAPPAPHARPVPWSRIEGMMLGLAIGDALGNTTEAQRPPQRQARHGEIRDYLPNRYAEGRAVGLPSDDSQLAFWTLDQIVRDGGTLLPDPLARRFASQPIFGIGGSVAQMIDNLRLRGLPWYEAATASAGNGALMRIAPVLIPHLRAPSPALWADTLLATLVTHNDTAALAASLGFIALLWDLLGMEQPPAPSWWLERFLAAARPLDTGALYTQRMPAPQLPPLPFCAAVESLVTSAAADGLTALEACQSWHSGAYLLETVPSALYILMRHAHDPEEAIVRAVNDTYDNDTVAAIVGAAVGALHGIEALPARWRDALLGRTGADDDGAAYALLKQARALFA